MEISKSNMQINVSNIQDLNGLTMDQLFQIAKHVNYSEPINKDLAQWTTDEVYYGGLKIMVQNPLLVQCIKNICKTFSPLTFLVKKRLKSYIMLNNSNYSSNN